MTNLNKNEFTLGHTQIAKGIAILKNKMSGNVITTDLYNIDDSVPYSAQIQLNDTFSYLTK